MTIKAIINAVKGERWCRLLTVLMRLTVGGVFIFSGFSKGVDPWGGCYKVTDYLTAMGMEQWTDTALFIAVALAALEFMLGIAIVVGAYRRSAPWLAALLLLLVMTPITLWLAVTGAVPDCGCFGDALHLSNWATFGKNLLLLLGVIYLLAFNLSVPGIYGPAVQWMVMFASFALIMAIAYYGYFKQPLIDYRPYPVGSRLINASVEDNDERGEDDFIFIYSRDGVEQEFTIDSLPDEEDGWEYVTRYHARRPHGKIIFQNGNQPGIAIMDEDGDDVTIDVLADSRRTVLLLFPDLPQVGVVNSYALNELNDAAQVADVDVVGLTPATAQEIDHWQDISMASYPIYNMDDSELKMVARGNPAVVYLEDGVIKWKQTLSSLEGTDQSVELSEVGNDYDTDSILTSLMIAFLAALAAILLINRSHVLLKRLFFREKPQQDDSTINTKL